MVKNTKITAFFFFFKNIRVTYGFLFLRVCVCVCMYMQMCYDNVIQFFNRSHELPKRDEETETQRKVRAKHARQTRRSTQVRK